MAAWLLLPSIGAVFARACSLVHSEVMAKPITLTPEERQADLDLDQLRQLVGLVEYDETRDPFPVIGWDALVFVVGNATQASHYFQSCLLYTSPSPRD